MKSLTGLADLARLLRALPPKDREAAAALLGLRRASSTDSVRIEAGRGKARGGDLVIRGAPLGATDLEEPSAASRAGFFRVIAAAETGPAARPTPASDHAGLTQVDLRSRPRAPLPPSPPLAPWSALRSRLGEALRSSRPGRDPDVAALTRTWSRGESLSRIPRRPRRTWAAAVSLWIDRSQRLTSFWDDQEIVYHELVRLCGVAAIQPRKQPHWEPRSM